MLGFHTKRRTFQFGVCALLSSIISFFILLEDNLNNWGVIFFLTYTIIAIIIYVISKYKYVKDEYKLLTRAKLRYLGFNIIPHFTVGGTMILNLGRNRFLSISSFGTPNEMLCIYTEDIKSRLCEEIIVISNYDYDGILTYPKLKSICKSFQPNK